MSKVGFPRTGKKHILSKNSSADGTGNDSDGLNDRDQTISVDPSMSADCVKSTACQKDNRGS
jgi:hypothetical protein